MTIDSLQRKIKTTEELRDIVTTMKTMSSASIGQYERAVKTLEMYRKNLRDAFHALALQSGLPVTPKNDNQAKKYLFILIGSDNGMVGKFNKEIIEKAIAETKQLGISKKDVIFITVGRRMTMLSEQKKFKIYAGYAVSNSVKAVNALTGHLILKIDDAIRQEHVNQVKIFYHTRHENVSVNVKKQTMIPVDFSRYKKLQQEPWKTNNIPLIGLPKPKLFKALVNEALMIGLAEKLNASLASEHFVRMTNMQNALKNIDESLEQMNLEYQQKRQEEITDELIDVITGAEAIKKKS